MPYHPRSLTRRIVAMTAVPALALALPLSIEAQDLGNKPASGDGFLFGRPTVTTSFYGGFARPSAGSDVFAFASDNLTLNKGDFAGFSFGGNMGFRMASRLELQIGANVMVRTVGSESRDFIGTDDLPIEQTTIFRRMPVTAGLKYYVTPPGRSLGKLAWVPNRFATYVAAGGGTMYYSFKQDGEFVDFETLDIFPASLESKAWTPSGYGAVGVDYTLSPRVGLTSEARYDFARAEMSREFQGFDRIDLSGISVNVGLNFRF